MYIQTLFRVIACVPPYLKLQCADTAFLHRSRSDSNDTLRSNRNLMQISEIFQQQHSFECLIVEFQWQQEISLDKPARTT